MTQDLQKTLLNEPPQVYDASLKNWILQQAPTILPILLPGTVYETTLDVEVIRPTMRVDKVFQVRYHEEEHVLHLEFETGYDDQLKSRLLVYNSILYRDHHLPVITIVIYPFRVTMAKPPLSIRSRKKPILTFHFQTLPLFKLDAEEIVRQHHTSLYPLLPTMKNIHANLITQAMQELTELYHDDEVSLSQQLVWMKLLLERTDIVTPLEKEKIKERLNMFDQLWEESPMIQKMREQYRVKGLQEGIQTGIQQGIQTGKVLALQEMLVTLIRASYPDLTELAQLRASHFDKPDLLERLIQKVVTAPNADAVQQLLESGPEL